VATVTSTRQARIAWAVTFLTVALLTLSRVLLPGQDWRLTAEFIASLGNALTILACAGVGLLIISRRPGNVIGWIYALVALVFAAGSYASRPLPGGVWVALIPTWRGSWPFLWARRCCWCCIPPVGRRRRAGGRWFGRPW
jgi:hypothetical protein